MQGVNLSYLLTGVGFGDFKLSPPRDPKIALTAQYASKWHIPTFVSVLLTIHHSILKETLALYRNSLHTEISEIQHRLYKTKYYRLVLTTLQLVMVHETLM